MVPKDKIDSFPLLSDHALFVQVDESALNNGLDRLSAVDLLMPHLLLVEHVPECLELLSLVLHQQFFNDFAHELNIVVFVLVLVLHHCNLSEMFLAVVLLCAEDNCVEESLKWLVLSHNLAPFCRGDRLVNLLHVQKKAEQSRGAVDLAARL